MTSEITVYKPDQFLVLQGDTDFDELRAANFLPGDEPGARDLTRIVFPKEGRIFQWLGLDGLETAQVLRGVVIAQRVTRAMYISPYDPDDSAGPNCQSHDGVYGRAQLTFEDVPLSKVDTVGIFDSDSGEYMQIAEDGREWRYGGNCMKCPLNEWGSDFGGRKGKACTEYRHLIIQPLDDMWPVVLRLPPTQLAHWRQFLMALTKSRRMITSTVVELRVSEHEDLAVSVAGVLDADAGAELAALGRSTLAMIRESEAIAEATLTRVADPEAPDDDMPF